MEGWNTGVKSRNYLDFPKVNSTGISNDKNPPNPIFRDSNVPLFQMGTLISPGMA
jgi:hypothetical protein